MSYARCFEVDNEKMLERMERKGVSDPYTYYSYYRYENNYQNTFEERAKNNDSKEWRYK